MTRSLHASHQDTNAAATAGQQWPAAVRRVGARTAGRMLGVRGPARPGHATRGVDRPPAPKREFFTDPGTGTSDDSALLTPSVASVPPRHTRPPAQENR